VEEKYLLDDPGMKGLLGPDMQFAVATPLQAVTLKAARDGSFLDEHRRAVPAKASSCAFVFLKVAQADLPPLLQNQAALEIIRGVRTFLRGRAGERRCGFVTLANPKEKPP
jgi:hypothetical protein